MKSKRLLIPVLIAMAILAGVCAGGYWLYDRGRPAPVPMKRTLYEGVTYRRVVRYIPRFMVAHTLTIDTHTKGFRLFVTPPDHAEGNPLNARTTSQFMKDFGVQIAINGDGFFPWWSRSPADYYPHAGDPVTPNGYSASNGKIYARGLENPAPEPTLYISRLSSITFNKIPGKVFHAISGDRTLILQGLPVEGLDDSQLDPRTAIGVNKNGRWLYIVVVDGRQPFYSNGATFAELADLLIDMGAHYAMALDGGGSSTLVMEGEDGQPVILNSPIDNYIPGRERPVANHLGIFVK